MSANFAQLDFRTNAICMLILGSTIKELRELKKYLKYRIWVPSKKKIVGTNECTYWSQVQILWQCFQQQF